MFRKKAEKTVNLTEADEAIQVAMETKRRAESLKSQMEPSIEGLKELDEMNGFSQKMFLAFSRRVPLNNS